MRYYEQNVLLAVIDTHTSPFLIRPLSHPLVTYTRTSSCRVVASFVCLIRKLYVFTWRFIVLIIVDNCGNHKRNGKPVPHPRT